MKRYYRTLKMMMLMMMRWIVDPEGTVTESLYKSSICRDRSVGLRTHARLSRRLGPWQPRTWTGNTTPLAASPKKCRLNNEVEDLVSTLTSSAHWLHGRCRRSGIRTDHGVGEWPLGTALLVHVHDMAKMDAMSESQLRTVRSSLPRVSISKNSPGQHRQQTGKSCKRTLQALQAFPPRDLAASGMGLAEARQYDACDP